VNSVLTGVPPVTVIGTVTVTLAPAASVPKLQFTIS
jgi:hypothetical protein